MRIVALSGGVGGARLVQGLADVLPAGSLTVVANTGDDFDHLGLRICPDLDTLMYTLAGEAPQDRGWGPERESFEALDMIRRYGGADWFLLGDRDLGTHLYRTAQLATGLRLSVLAPQMCADLGVDGVRLLPMCDDPCPTIIDTADGESLAFQQWLVRRRAEPEVREVRWPIRRDPSPEVADALEAADVVIIPPSNPYVSVDPILTLRGVRSHVARTPTVAVSPIVGGRAVKGPLTQMIPALSGRAPSAAAVLAHFAGLVDGFVLERGDDAPGPTPLLHADTVMGGREDRARLAREVLSFAEGLL